MIEGGAVDTSFGMIVSLLTRGYDVVYSFASGTLYLLIIIDIVFFGIQVVYGKEQDLSAMVQKTLSIGVIVFLFRNLKAFAYLAKDSFVMIASHISPIYSIGPQQADWEISPSLIARHTFTVVVRPIIDRWQATTESAIENASISHAASALESGVSISTGDAVVGGAAIFAGIPNILMFIVILLLIITIMMIVNYIMAVAEFHLALIFAVALLPFQAFKPLQFMAAQVWPNVLAKTLRMGMIVFTNSVVLWMFSEVMGLDGSEMVSGAQFDQIEWIFSMILMFFFIMVMQMSTNALAEAITTGKMAMTVHEVIKVFNLIINPALFYKKAIANFGKSIKRATTRMKRKAATKILARRAAQTRRN
jgi:hypothetical protein